MALAALTLTGCGGQQAEAGGPPVTGVTTYDGDGLNGVVLPTPYDVPAVTLEGADGRSRTLPEDVRAPLTLMFFGYVSCPDVCQVVMANISSALVRLPQAERDKVEMIFVTTDPARDTAPALRRYLDRFDPSFQGLTGHLRTIVRLGKAFDVEIAKGQKLASGGYDVAHGSQIVGLLPDGRAPFVWTEGTSPAALSDDVTSILEDKVPGL